MVAILPAAKTMELEGNLKAFQLPDILRFLAMGKMSGVLTVQSRERTIQLTFREGAIIGSAAGDRFPRLGQMLVYGGLISRKQLEEVLDSQRDPSTSKMLGELLVEKGLVGVEQIEAALQLQVREELWDLFSWADGTFKFEHGLRAAQHRLFITLEVEPLIEEGFEHLERWRVIAGNLSDPDLVFRTSPDLAIQPEARLTPNMWRVLSLINGRHTIQVLIYLSGIGRFETLCALDRLLSLSLIEPLTGRPRVYDSGRLAESAKASPNPEVITEADEEGDEGGRRGFFGKRRRAQRKDAPHMPPPEDKRAPSRVGPYVTGAGLCCAVISRLAARLCAEADFRSEGGVTALTEALWNELGMRHPRADLIVLRDGRFDADGLENYVRRAGGFSPALAGPMEDSLEALAQLGRRLLLLGQERLGDRARRIVNETLRPYLDYCEFQFGGDFNPRLWAEHWLDSGQ